MHLSDLIQVLNNRMDADKYLMLKMLRDEYMYTLPAADGVEPTYSERLCTNVLTRLDILNRMFICAGITLEVVDGFNAEANLALRGEDRPIYLAFVMSAIKKMKTYSPLIKSMFEEEVLSPVSGRVNFESMLISCVLDKEECNV